MSGIINSKKEFNLTSDKVFKKYYSDPKRLKTMLKIVLNMDVDTNEIAYSNTEVTNGMDLKTERYDLRIRIISEELYEMELEMQNSNHFGLEERMLAYTSQLLALSIKEKEKYVTTSNVIGLWFINFQSESFPNCVNTFELLDENNLNSLTNKFKIIVINLKKKDNCDKILLKEYIDIMNNINVSSYAESKYSLIKEAATEMKEFTQEEKDAWEAFQQHDDLMLRNAYKDEGKQELIRTMSRNGLSLEQISNVTEIDILEVEKIVKNL